MDRVKSIALLAGLSAALAACAGQVAAPITEVNRGLESVNQPVVQRTDYVIDLLGAQNGLEAAERQRLDAWFGSLALGYGDRIWVDEPNGSTRARQDIARVAADYGILLSDGAPVTAGAVQPGAVRVIVSRSTAHVPGCPIWKGTEGASATSANYGCATNSNLAAMIADPSDLVLGEAGDGSGDATTTTKLVKIYRDIVPTGVKGTLKSESSKGGN